MGCTPINIWLLVIVITSVLVLLATLLFYFQDLKKRVNEYRKATEKKFPELDGDGKPKLGNDGKPQVRTSEIDPEDALRLVLDQRMKALLGLIAFAALIAVLSTIVVVSHENKTSIDNEGKSSPTGATTGAVMQSANAGGLPTPITVKCECPCGAKPSGADGSGGQGDRTREGRVDRKR